MTLPRRAAPVRAQPPGSAAPAHRGKPQHSTLLTHCSNPHIITGSESHLWSFQCVTWLLCPISQHPVTPWHHQAPADVTSLAYVPEMTGLNYGEQPTHQNMVKAQQDQEILWKAALPKQDAVVQFYVQVQPKP